MGSCRSLVIVQVPPYPPTGGVALRNWQTLNLLKHQGEVAIFSIYKGSDRAAQELTQQGFKLAHYDIASPQRPWTEKVKNRLGYLRSDGYSYADWLYTADAAKALGQLVETFQPSLMVFEELWLYPYLQVVKNHPCAIVLDNHNIEGNKEDYRLPRRTLRQIRHIEQTFIQRADQTWVCSPVDADQIRQLYGISHGVKVIPNGLQAEFYRQVNPPASQNHSPKEPHHLLFLGKFSYYPNEEAALILIQEIYPALKRRYPDSQLWLVGRDPTAAMATAAKLHNNIHITGMVPDVRPYLNRASAMVVPLRQGGGTRLKILEAFASYCPVVSTAKGAEGLGVKDNHHLWLGETAAQMVEKVDYLWQNPALDKQITAHAYDLFIHTYAWAAVEPSIASAVADLHSQRHA
ncbi:glycosyltransferase family 4 protein [Leptothoe sp. PORK10 BA2]|uniref:glycosyltransferase family 4 protein n=1 Tax=Leptothoe sp. PORK10 BA2 TaxID=3110254 RepID=UPI002B1F11ED|nr:glycosyltransferase family 4 protein [Leptothoe sp. PORK10 BA2]MEA5462452.1 glycosyltransferase family 4 protein [Leptothoe sp. PORK10 BA2]